MVSDIGRTTGEQKTLVLLINGVTTVEQAESAFFADVAHSLDHYYRASSQGRCWFTGDVVVVEIAMPPCQLSTTAGLAEQAAVAKGVDLEQYDRRVYIGQFGCSTPGIATIGQRETTPGGRRYGRVWLQGLGNWTHEMGHSLGMLHANNQANTAYTDPTDVMGNGPNREINAPHRVQMNWFEPTNLVDVAAEGVYTVAALEVRTLAPQILRISKPNSAECYFVSYRQPLGPYDGSFYDGLTHGASVHTWSPETNTDGIGQTTRFIDTAPGSSEQQFDSALQDGAQYVDASAGITIRQLGHAIGLSGYATIGVYFGAAPPPPPEPPAALEILPAAVTLRAGQSQEFLASQSGVQWELSGPGTLTMTGHYTAPPRIPRRVTAIVRVTNGPESASAVVTLAKGKG